MIACSAQALNAAPCRHACHSLEYLSLIQNIKVFRFCDIPQVAPPPAQEICIVLGP